MLKSRRVVGSHKTSTRRKYYSVKSKYHNEEKHKLPTERKQLKRDRNLLRKLLK